MKTALPKAPSTCSSPTWAYCGRGMRYTIMFLNNGHLFTSIRTLTGRQLVGPAGVTRVAGTVQPIAVSMQYTKALEAIFIQNGNTNEG